MSHPPFFYDFLVGKQVAMETAWKLQSHLGKPSRQLDEGEIVYDERAMRYKGKDSSAYGLMVKVVIFRRIQRLILLVLFLVMGTHEDERLEERLLLEDGLPRNESSGLYTGDGSVDIKGQPVLKSNTGNWRACPFILGTECCERLAYYGIATNLVTYLTTKLHEGNVSAARNVTTWAGTCYLTPLLEQSWQMHTGEDIGQLLSSLQFISLSSFWPVTASFKNLEGMCTLTLSASVPAFKPAECVGSICPSATPAQYAVFFFGLYLIALGTGGIKPCVSSFGADQFDDTDPKERVKKGSFFNWFYFSINIGALVSSSLIVWIQENAGWGLGFGIPAVFMAIAIGSFFSGTPLYRFQKPGGSPLTRMCQVLVASFRKWNLNVPTDTSLLYETPDKTSAIEGSRKLQHTDELKCLDKAAVISDAENKTGDYSNPWRLCTVTQIEELKILIRMFPIWATGIVFAAFTHKWRQCLLSKVYDSFLVPIARKFTGKGRGFSELQRMGIGLFLSIFCMSAAALLEMKRLSLAKSLGLLRYLHLLGKLEFFYDQSPDAMRSLCSALSLLTTSLGNYLSSFILTVVTSITTQGGKTGWIPDNLNEGHLDHFFWLLAGLSFFNMVVYVFCAKMYKQKNAA
ncbi:peptide transporter 2 [Actinidia rufa]|uniref:Peptide transporter 2 n=1 Tax=Actinidia rufa TaxID=165716 RepID=A0A7J0HEC6_9ERIC|nr:peptide transporter 2 [Actinidia rufa]